MPLNFRVQGELNDDALPIVLVHGLFGSMENLGALARSLSAHFRVYSVDLPNHGRSPHVDTMTLSSIAGALLEWMDEQAIAQAFYIGHSLGGKAVMEMALMAPDRCLKLAVIDIAPVHYEPHHLAVFDGLLSISPAELSSRTAADEALKRFVPESAVRSFLLKNLQKNEVGFVWRMNLPAIHHDYPALIAANREAKTPFEGEVLFVKGGDSPYILESHRTAILSRFPKAKTRVVMGTGHWLHAEKPDHVAQILLRFLVPK